MAYRRGGGAVVDRTEGEDDWAAGAAPSIVPVLSPEASRTPSCHPTRPELPPCPEIDCVRALLPTEVVATAELRAAEAGVGADRVLITEGHITEERYLEALSVWLGLPFETLEGHSRPDCPLPDERMIEAGANGMLPLTINGDIKILLAPPLVDSRRLVKVVRSGSDLTQRIRITSTERLRRFVVQHGSDEIERRAADALRSRRPDLSAAGVQPNALWLIPVTGIAALAAVAAPAAAMVAVEILLGVVFLAWTGLRLLGSLSKRLIRCRPQTVTDDALPAYTIVVALYREVAAAEGLIRTLSELHYPKEKLQVILALEPDDHVTRDALTQFMPSAFEIVVAPEGGPRTKPKALNAALPFVRGKYVAVYDAEDRPEPDQLLVACEAFAANDTKLACVQARLTIDNTSDSWLTRLFTAEYAGLFDVFLPGLAVWQLPLPLGGSSNHFRTDILRKVGAWDPYNVTEDADLGMRLARFGYRTAVIPSTTYEEAPVKFGPWLRQRTRWCKGWLQTWFVHMRSPVRLARELGLPGFAVFQLIVGGTVLAALVHVLFVVEFLRELATTPDIASSSMFHFYTVTLIAGYLASIGIAIVGLWRRQLMSCSWVLLFMPIYWLMLSFAAWRALIQLVRDPYHWEKTEHGLAKTSRRAAIRIAEFRRHGAKRR